MMQGVHVHLKTKKVNNKTEPKRVHFRIMYDPMSRLIEIWTEITSSIDHFSLVWKTFRSSHLSRIVLKHGQYSCERATIAQIANDKMKPGPA